MKIGQVASQAGVSIDTVRYYERRGVLPAAPRTAAGYRVYTEAAVARIRLARRLQSLGLTLDEIIGALHAQDAGHASCESERWRLRAALGRDRVQRSRTWPGCRARSATRSPPARPGTCGVLAG